MTDFDRKAEAKRAANRERQRRYRQQRRDLVTENRRLQAEVARLRGTDHHQRERSIAAPGPGTRSSARGF